MLTRILGILCPDLAFGPGLGAKTQEWYKPVKRLLLETKTDSDCACSGPGETHAKILNAAYT
jgi:hypothetical protein